MATPCVVIRDPEVEKAFWKEGKARLAVGVEPEDIIVQLAKKHRLGTDVVANILNSKNLSQLTMEAWTKLAKLSDLRSAVKREVRSANDPPWLRNLKKYNPYELTRRSLTVGHGGVIPFSHARTAMLTPGETKMFGEAVRDAYSYMTPNTGSARWRADMATLRTDPKFRWWDRAGLDIKLQSQPLGMGMSRWTRHSFDALKTLRLKMAKKYWNDLDPVDRTFEEAQSLAKRINHATGTISLGPRSSKFLGATTFAPKLRAAKYASVVDAVTSKFGAKRLAKVAAVNFGILAVNDLVNRFVLQSNDNVNWDTPSRADWLRMKIGGMTIPMSPLFETARLPFAAGAVMMNPMEDNKAKVLTKEIASAAHPGINAIYGGVTGTDLATGKTLPFKGASQYIYGEHRGEKKMFGKLVKNKYEQKMGVGEYVSHYLPIPAQPIVTELVKNGVTPELAKSFVEAIFSGGAGTHVYPDVPYKKNP